VTIDMAGAALHRHAKRCGGAGPLVRSGGKKFRPIISLMKKGRSTRWCRSQRRAWIAGVSFWAGDTNINARSIGIELVNPGMIWLSRFCRAQIRGPD